MDISSDDTQKKEEESKTKIYDDINQDITQEQDVLSLSQSEEKLIDLVLLRHNQVAETEAFDRFHVTSLGSSFVTFIM